MADPLLADTINPRLALQRRMQAEGQAPAALPDTRPQSAVRFGRQYTPEEKARQQALLVKLLKSRDSGVPSNGASSPTP